LASFPLSQKAVHSACGPQTQRQRLCERPAHWRRSKTYEPTGIAALLLLAKLLPVPFSDSAKSLSSTRAKLGLTSARLCKRLAAFCSRASAKSTDPCIESCTAQALHEAESSQPEDSRLRADHGLLLPFNLTRVPESSRYPHTASQWFGTVLSSLQIVCRI